MKILLILLMSLIGLLGAIKIFITWCFVTREKWEDFCNEVIFLVRKEKIPIMEDVVVLGLLASDGFKGITDDNENTYSTIKTRNFCGFHNLFKKKTPEIFYNTFKRELCGDLPIKWKQALQEANTLRLENLNK